MWGSLLTVCHAVVLLCCHVPKIEPTPHSVSGSAPVCLNLQRLDTCQANTVLLDYRLQSECLAR